VGDEQTAPSSRNWRQPIRAVSGVGPLPGTAPYFQAPAPRAQSGRSERFVNHSKAAIEAISALVRAFRGDRDSLLYSRLKAFWILKPVLRPFRALGSCRSEKVGQKPVRDCQVSGALAAATPHRLGASHSRVKAEQLLTRVPRGWLASAVFRNRWSVLLAI